MVLNTVQTLIGHGGTPAATTSRTLNPQFFHEPIDATTTELQIPQLHAHRQKVNTVQAAMLNMQHPQFPLHRVFFATDPGVTHRLALSLGVEGASVDTKHPTHRRDSEDLWSVIRLHELIDGANLVYRSLRLVANQAAAFSRISLSSRDCLFSLKRRFSLSASHTSTRGSDSAATQCRIVASQGS